MARAFIIQGHRGARGLRPENTLPSFEAALDSGAGSLETDVHLTADGVPVLIHGPELPGKPVPVHSASTAEAAALGVPTLADLFRFVNDYSQNSRTKTETQRANAARVIIDIEIKTTPFCPQNELGIDSIERAVLRVVHEHGAIERTWVRCFDHRVVCRMRQLEPRLTGVVLIEGTTPVDPASLVRAADAQVYAPDYRFLDEEQVRRCQSEGYRVLPWTVNEPKDWERLVEWGVNGITTDFPGRLADWLKASGVA